MAELKIIHETENPLFKRKEIIADWTDETLPKSTDVATTLSEKFSVPLGNVALKNIKGRFGSKTFEDKFGRDTNYTLFYYQWQPNKNQIKLEL